MHKVAADIEAAIRIPLLHIADATAEVIVDEGIASVGLLGTAFTMEQTFYKNRLIDRYGLRVSVPNDSDRRLIHDVIYRELCLGNARAESKAAYLRIIDDLAAKGAEAVILGCTDVRLLDTTEIHAQKAVAYALQ